MFAKECSNCQTCKLREFCNNGTLEICKKLPNIDVEEYKEEYFNEAYQNKRAMGLKLGFDIDNLSDEELHICYFHLVCEFEKKHQENTL